MYKKQKLLNYSEINYTGLTRGSFNDLITCTNNTNKLIINNCILDIESHILIRKLIKNSPNLNTLILRNINFFTYSLGNLIETLTDYPNLEKLEITDNPNIRISGLCLNRKDLTILFTRLPKLKSLKINQVLFDHKVFEELLEKNFEILDLEINFIYISEICFRNKNIKRNQIISKLIFCDDVNQIIVDYIMA